MSLLFSRIADWCDRTDTWSALDADTFGLLRIAFQRGDLPPRRVCLKLARAASKGFLLLPCCIDDHWVLVVLRTKDSRLQFTSLTPWQDTARRRSPGS